jgi:hypothetical protein
MTRKPRLIFATPLCIAALAMAPLASAAPSEMSGTYNSQVAGLSGSINITFTPCGDGCAFAVFPNGGGMTQAHLDGGQWAMTLPNPNGFVCTDGSYHPGEAHYAWDANSLTGSYWNTDTTGACGPVGGGTNPSGLTLTKVG